MPPSSDEHELHTLCELNTRLKGSLSDRKDAWAAEWAPHDQHDEAERSSIAAREEDGVHRMRVAMTEMQEQNAREVLQFQLWNEFMVFMKAAPPKPPKHPHPHGEAWEAVMARKRAQLLVDNEGHQKMLVAQKEMNEWLAAESENNNSLVKVR